MSRHHSTAHNTGCFYISSDGVRILLDQRVGISGHDGEAASHGHCLALVGERLPRSFRVTTSAQASSSYAEIWISKCLVERLPVLLDIASCTVNGSSSRSHATVLTTHPQKRGRDDAGLQLRLPFGVCGLVSLLLLLEETVHVQRWFDSSCERNVHVLAVQTLEV